MDMGRGEERVGCMERITWKLTLPYVKQIANGEFAAWLGKLNQGLYINLEGWDREEDGRAVLKGGHIWLIHVEKTTKFYKAIILQ